MKNDLKHLRRSELIDLIYEMKKREIVKCTPCQGQIKKKGFLFSGQ